MIVAGIMKALSDENRLRALYALRGRELCICQITELLGLAQPTVSKHMSLLKQAGLVSGRKEGRWMYYSLPGDKTPLHIREIIDWTCGMLKATDTIKKDVRKLNGILKIDKEILCRAVTCRESKR